MTDVLNVRTVVERLLQRDIPDQIGETSGVQFELTGMRTTNLHLPSAALIQDKISAKRGGLSMTGKYRFTYGSLLSGDGDFDVIVSGLSLVISLQPRHHQHRQHNPRHARASPVNSSHGDQHTADHDTIMRFIHHGHVVCQVKSVKIKFRGKSSRLCGFLTKVFSRWIATQLQVSTADFVKSWFKEEPDMSVIALMALFAMNDQNAADEEESRNRCWRFRRRRELH
ncbi:uncharacterized protein LOC125670836 [Ostrea edulis]|uniref:uncharacterized protein LOC125670836 n=1 Tax=Ostrea edulis TaxID=37623 RepID=UPI0020947B48|nr:uncharacterized protein LOC125670836 [Ostrea edulis]XP_048762191.1 uncharacterized protein LOC125670836 [Ostrea edulis]XP_048762193.1 uncharacterized protein LOC125670836 [Ostrea edulis]XP_048762194.1 uncharacterized protein LOC125670836 [Ostrea edulis]XP_048762195.1 uncharacterized protein LOC125670836 [Ostrea edulis]XP_056019745.1 uncharacterized protein LOC125670836 [Ostrea edulis]XP_056019746.1 uncharacterized protein LOC125670836 [Ostrea edulis]